MTNKIYIKIQDWLIEKIQKAFGIISPAKHLYSGFKLEKVAQNKKKRLNNKKGW